MRAILVVAILCASCCPAPAVRPGPVASRSWEPLLEACRPVGDGDLCCPVSTLRQSAIDAAQTWEAAELCRVDLREAQELAGIDKAELRGAVQRAEQERDSARGQRWIWGAVGLAVGVIATGLAVGLSQ